MSETSSLCVLIYNKTFLELYLNGSQNILQKYSPDIGEICININSFYMRGCQVWEKLSSFLNILEEGNNKYGTE